MSTRFVNPARILVGAAAMLASVSLALPAAAQVSLADAVPLAADASGGAVLLDVKFDPDDGQFDSEAWDDVNGVVVEARLSSNGTVIRVEQEVADDNEPHLASLVVAAELDAAGALAEGAQRAAAAFPSATPVETEFEFENGSLVVRVELVEGDRDVRVEYDPSTFDVVRTDDDDDDDGDDNGGGGNGNDDGDDDDDNGGGGNGGGGPVPMDNLALDQAVQLAADASGDSMLLDVKLDSDNDRWVYESEAWDAAASLIVEIDLDARTGAVLKTEREQPDAEDLAIVDRLAGSGLDTPTVLADAARMAAEAHPNATPLETEFEFENGVFVVRVELFEAGDRLRVHFDPFSLGGGMTATSIPDNGASAMVTAIENACGVAGTGDWIAAEAVGDDAHEVSIMVGKGQVLRVRVGDDGEPDRTGDWNSAIGDTDLTALAESISSVDVDAAGVLATATSMKPSAMPRALRVDLDEGGRLVAIVEMRDGNGELQVRIDVATGEASLHEVGTTACRADVNRDGAVDPHDMLSMIDAWLRGAADADFDASGNVTLDDLMQFLDTYFNGC